MLKLTSSSGVVLISFEIIAPVWYLVFVEYFNLIDGAPFQKWSQVSRILFKHAVDVVGFDTRIAWFHALRTVT